MVRGEYLENSIAAVKTTLVSTVQKKKKKKKTSTKRHKYKQSLFFSEHWRRLTVSTTPREGLSGK